MFQNACIDVIDPLVADFASTSSAFGRPSGRLFHADTEVKQFFSTATISCDCITSHPRAMASTNLAGVAHQALLAEQSRLFEGMCKERVAARSHSLSLACCSS